MSDPRPRLAVFKFASCDGCQLSVVEAGLLALSERFAIETFLEVSSRTAAGAVDLALVEGSITTAHDIERIRAIRERARTLIAIGACATAGGIQALRNGADVEEWKAHVYPQPRWIDCLPTSTAIADHVRVDHQIHGCPPSPQQILRTLTRALLGARPDLPGESVCMECKRRGNVCVLVAKGAPCMGPVTRAGCGALCPSQGRDCYACFGPSEDPNTDSLARRFASLGLERRDIARRIQGVENASPAFRAAAQRIESGDV